MKIATRFYTKSSQTTITVLPKRQLDWLNRRKNDNWRKSWQNQRQWPKQFYWKRNFHCCVQYTASCHTSSASLIWFRWLVDLKCKVPLEIYLRREKKCFCWNLIIFVYFLVGCVFWLNASIGFGYVSFLLSAAVEL